MGRLQDRQALVTGASRGIGRGIALELAREGAHVAVHYRREEAAARSTVEAIRELGREAFAVQADVSDWEAVQHMAAEVHERFTGLEIVVANSGVASRIQPLWEIDPGYWQRVVGIDLNGAFHTCRATVKPMIDRGRGTIILVSSIGADACAPFGAPYYVAKAGVNALTKCLARECAPARVRVNAIAPGLVRSDMGEKMIEMHGDALVQSIPLSRAGTPEEIGRAAVYLASDDAAFITGKILRIDGGAWM